MSARVWTIAGLLTGAAGLVLQQAGGVVMPTVPPGLIFLVVAAGLMAVKRWKWAAIAAILAAGAEIAGFFGSGNAARLTGLDQFGAFTGSWIRLAGIVVALIAGVAATRAAYQGRPSASRNPA
jgi:hypothetical protein